MWEYNMYGLKPMTNKEAWDAPSAVNSIRANKIKIGNYVHDILTFAEDIRNRARNIPEEDDPKHAGLVEQYAEKVKAAYQAVLEAENFAKR